MRRWSCKQCRRPFPRHGDGMWPFPRHGDGMVRVTLVSHLVGYAIGVCVSNRIDWLLRMTMPSLPFP